MGDSLSCPECGRELKLSGRTAGQRFSCQWCKAVVEVPALARTIKRGRRIATPRDQPPARVREANQRVWASLGLGLLALLLLVFVAKWTFALRARNLQLRAVEELAAQAKVFAKERNYGSALHDVQAAMTEASKIEPKNEALIAKLQDLHDQIIVNDVKAEFPKIEVFAPEQKVGAYRVLRARIRDNPKLARYEEVANSRLNQAYEQWGEADVKLAANVFLSNNAARAMDLCERAVGNTAALSTARSHAIRAQADALAEQIIPRRGLKLDKIQGVYTLGSEADYSGVMQRDLAELLRQRGYVVRPESSLWDVLWNRQTPFRAVVEVKESYGGLYPQTKCRISYAAAHVWLVQDQAGKKTPIWEGAFAAATKQKPRNLKEFRNEFHNPDVERIFYDDAKAAFGKGIMPKLQTVPAYKSLPGSES